MAATATVSLVVDETGSVAGLTRFQQRAMAAFKGPKAEANGLQQAIVALTAALERSGNAGKIAGDAQAAGHDKAKAHALSNLDSVRLLRDDLGVRIPRAMEKLIASTQAFQTIASVAFSGLAFVGILELAGSIGSKFWEWGQALLGDTKAVRDLHDALVAANNERMVNPTNSDQAAKNREALLHEQHLLDIRKESNKISQIPGWLIGNAVGNEKYESEDEKSQLKFMTEKDYARLIEIGTELNQLNENSAKHNQQINAEDIHQKRQNAEIELEGFRKIAQARANAHAEVFDKVNGTNGQQKTLTAEQGKHEDELIDQKYGAESVVLQRQYADEVRAVWQASVVSRLQGEQRAYKETEDAVNDFGIRAKRQGRSPAETNGVETAMWEKYLHEKALRQQQFTDETMRLADQVRIYQSEGTQRTLAEETAALNDLTRERISSGRQAEEYDAQYEARRKEIHERTAAEISKSVREYANNERQTRDSLAVSTTHGYAQISAEATKRYDDELKKYQELTNGLKTTDQAYVDASAAYNRQLQDIAAATAEKRKELHQRNDDETQAISDQAASARSGGSRSGLLGALTSAQDESRKLQAEWTKRSHARQEAEDSGVLTHQEATNRQRAIDELYTAQYSEMQRTLRDKLASSIESGFRDPLGAIKDIMKRQMAEIIADWLMQLSVFKHMTAATLGGGGTTAQGGSLVSAVMGTRGAAAPMVAGAPAATSGATLGGGATSAAYPAWTLPGGSTANVANAAGYGGGVSSIVSGIGGIPTPSASAAGFTNIGGSPATIDAGASVPFADNGEDGGFSGYMTGATDDMSSAQQQQLEAAGGGNVTSAAGQQASSLSQQMALQGMSGTTSAALGIAGAGLGAYTGVTGLISSFESGKASGILSGAESGAELGGSVGMLAGPVGGLIGAGVGAAGGAVTGLVGWATGAGSNLGAEKYYKSTVLPQMDAAVSDYAHGGEDSTAALSALDSASTQGFNSIMKQFGLTSANWIDAAYIRKERARIAGQINQMGAGGRDYMSASAAQFHTGGRITDFGDWSTSSTEGMIHALIDETVMKPAATYAHGPYLNAMNSGASESDIAGMYLRNAGNFGSPSGGGSVVHNHTHNYDIDSLNPKSFRDFLVNGGGQAEIEAAANKRASRNGSDAGRLIYG